MLASCLRTCICTWVSSYILPAALPTSQQHQVVSLASRVCWRTQNGNVKLAWVICTGRGMVAFLCEVLHNTVIVKDGSVCFVSTATVLTKSPKGACAPVRTDGMTAGNVAVATNIVSGRSSYLGTCCPVVQQLFTLLRTKIGNLHCDVRLESYGCAYRLHFLHSITQRCTQRKSRHTTHLRTAVASAGDLLPLSMSQHKFAAVIAVCRPASSLAGSIEL